MKLVQEKIVRDWDDPRLFTLTALRRRGFPAEAINTFVAKLGMTMALGAVDPQMLEAVVRDVLNYSAPRAMAVLEPLKLTIDNWDEFSFSTSVSVPDYPAEPERGSHSVDFHRVLYIDRSDFREIAEKGFKRLTPNQSVGLKHVSCVISVKDIKQDDSGNISELIVTCQSLSDSNKPKGFIQWIANPLECEVRLYERLFKHRNPEDVGEVPGGFLTDCNLDSLKVISNAMVDKSVLGAKVYDKFQFERIGFFSVDPDSSSKKLVFNRTVLLKEDSSKNA